ncbi:unnamed protein product [Periconia digitata]|uniref:Uncharacterized protein n=1 Tax=Periconia digitata TaxID=1303443 RepID=A0A9W4UUC4_9PLEO|nr:unnamed protein product [Periconia digitata]
MATPTQPSDLKRITVSEPVATQHDNSVLSSVCKAFDPRGLRSSSTRFRRLAMYIVLALQFSFHIYVLILLNEPLKKLLSPMLGVWYVTWGMTKMENAGETTRFFFRKVTLTKRFLNGSLYTSAVLHIACLVMLVAWRTCPEMEIFGIIWLLGFWIQVFMISAVGLMVALGVEDKPVLSQEEKGLSG